MPKASKSDGLKKAISDLKKEMPRDWTFPGLDEDERKFSNAIDKLTDQLATLLAKQNAHLNKSYARIWGNALDYFIDNVSIDLLIDPAYKDGIKADISLNISHDGMYDYSKSYFEKKFPLRAQFTGNTGRAETPEEEIELLVGKFRTYLQKEYNLDVKA